MKRTVFLVLGSALVLTWFIAMTRPVVPGWTTAWLDVLMAVWAFTLALGSGDGSDRGRRYRLLASVSLAVGLFCLWGLALAAGVQPWLSWANFAIACGFLIVAAIPEKETRREATVHQFRRAS